MKKPLIIIAAVLAFVLLLLAVGIILLKSGLIPREKFENGDFNIADYKSAVDMDGDGIDDQTDILNSVKEYIEKKPKYKSRYYAGGYPDDGYGVCTDVVAQGLLGAGYDLMRLVDDDVRANPGAYSIEKPDKNIDFRRVRNLKVYFDNTAVSLTTDVKEIEKWQGGDIVVFKGHIGVVSEHRNKNGVPFVYHHANPFQIYFEEDILESRDDILGHYRVS